MPHPGADAERERALAVASAKFDGCGAAKLGREAYFEALFDSRFVLCPRGFGLATFRFYEALLAGAVPVVDTAADPGGRLLEDLYRDMPVLSVSRAFEDLDPDLLEGAWGRLRARDAENALDVKAAFLPYWIREIARASLDPADGPAWLAA